MRPTNPATRQPAPERRRAAGFTLLEMLVVIGLLGVLMGLGVGFLRRAGGGSDLALAIVRDQVRVAALTARTRHLPTEVVLESGGTERPAAVHARVLAPVGQWHMEDRQSLDDDAGLDSQLAGEVEPGRFGFARRPPLDRRTSLLSVPTQGRAAFDLREGFALRVDLRLEERTAMTIARLGTALDVRLDDDLYPTVKLVGTTGGGAAGAMVQAAGKRPLPIGRWLTLAVVHDGSRLSLMVGDQLADLVDAPLPILQTAGDVFVVSPGTEPVIGLVDEVQLLAYESGAEQLLPIGIELVASPSVFRFDRNGDLVEPCRFTLRDGDDERTHAIAPGGVVE